MLYPGSTEDLDIGDQESDGLDSSSTKHDSKKQSDNNSADENPVLDTVNDHLDADRTVVIHDLLAHLAREMTQLKEERHTYHLDVTDYVAAPESGQEGGVGLRAIGRYQPVPGATDSLLAATTEQRDGLRIGRLTATHRGDAVIVRATARFKPPESGAGTGSVNGDTWPDVVPDDAEPDQWGYVETEPLPVCTLHDCTEIETGLVVHWLQALNDADAGFSGYRDTATKTISLLDRIYDIRFPDPSSSSTQNALKSFLDNVKEAEQLDEQIITDQLIDDVVYRLYDLTEEELWFDGRLTLCLSEPIVTEYQRVLREIGAVSAAEERALIEAFASGEDVLYTADPPAIESASLNPDDDRFLECALELEANRVVSGDSDLLGLESYMGVPILTPRELLEEAGEAPGG